MNELAASAAVHAQHERLSSIRLTEHRRSADEPRTRRRWLPRVRRDA